MCINTRDLLRTNSTGLSKLYSLSIIFLFSLILPSCTNKILDQQSSLSTQKKSRIAAADRQRRIIFNDDTYELSRNDANTAEGFLKRRLKPLVGTQVDTISWSILGGWADAPVYDSKLQPIYGDAHGGPPEYWSKVTSNVKELIQAGRGPLQIVIDFAHKEGMEIFASVRMNDVHDSFIGGGLTLWKKEHPHFLVDPLGIKQPSMELYITAQDFSHKAVRQRKFEIIEEVAQRYNVDGFELDFIRHPVFFSQTLHGQPVNQNQIDIMTRFMERIRQMTDKEANRRGRPLLLATRVPDSFKLALDVGLDVAHWVKKDLVDILIAGGGYSPFSLPTKKFTQLAHKHGVLVYPCINQGAAQNVSRGSFLEGVRALATNWFQSGADGIYFWNLGTPFEYKTGQDLVKIRTQSYACLVDIGEPQTLLWKNKLFCVDNIGGTVFDYYRHISSKPPLPVRKIGPIKYGVVARVPLVVGENLKLAKKNGKLKGMNLVLDVRGLEHPETVVCRVNGTTLVNRYSTVTKIHEQEYTISYPVNTPPFKQGENYVVMALKRSSNKPSTVRPESRRTPASHTQLNGLRLKIDYVSD